MLLCARVLKQNVCPLLMEPNPRAMKEVMMDAVTSKTCAYSSLLGAKTVKGPGPSRMEGRPQFCGSGKEAQGGSVAGLHL